MTTSTFQAKAVITTYPGGDKYEFRIFTEEQLDKLKEIFRLLEQSAKDEQEQLMQQSQADDEAKGE